MKCRLTIIIVQILLFQNIFFAQNNFEIVGPTTTCVGSCENYVPNFSDVNLEYIQILYQGIPDSFGCHTYRELPENNFMVCYNCPGTYTIFGYYYGSNGGAFYDSLEVYVNYPDQPVIITKDPKTCDQSVSPQGCLEVCAGSTKTYYLDQPFNEINWNVTGAVSYVTNWNEVTVTWGNGPSGYINVFTNTGQQCFTETGLCFEIVDPEVPDFNIGGSEFCVNQNITLTTDYLDGEIYEWDFGNGQKSNEIQPIIAYDAPGTYQIAMTVTTACGCRGTKVRQVTIKESYLPTIDCASTICENTEMTYTTSADCGNFYWKIIGDGQLIAGGGTQDKYITILWGNGPAGTIELEVAACNFDQCPAKATFEIPIISDLAMIDGNQIACSQSKEIYSLQKYGATEYTWNVTGGTITAGQGSSAIIVEWNNGNKGTVSVDYNNCYLKCGGNETIDVTISLKYHLTTSVSSLCAGEMVEVKAADNNAGPIIVDNWTVTDDAGNIVYTNSNSSSIQIQVPDQTATLHISSFAAAYCIPNQEIKVDVLPKSSLPTRIKGELFICKNTAYLYTAETDLTNNTFFWTITDGTNITNQQGKDIIVQWNTDGPYSLSLSQLDLSGQFCVSNQLTTSISKVDKMEISAPVTACLYDKTSVSATAYEGMNYLWTLSPADAGTIISSDDQITEIIWSKAGTHTIELNTCAGLKTTNITINSLPVPVVDHPAFLCENAPANVKTTLTYNAYRWLNADGNLISDNDQPSLKAGTYVVEATDSNGCIGKESFTIDQLPKPNIFLSTPDNTAVFVSGPSPVYPLLYALDAEDGYTFRWLRNGTQLPDVTNTYGTNSIGSYQVEVTDQFGCTNISNSVVVYDIDDITHPGPTMSCNSLIGKVGFTHSSMDCNTISFESTSTNLIAGSERWSFDDSGPTDLSDIKKPIHDFSNAGYFKVAHTITVDDTSNPGKTCQKTLLQTIEVPMKAEFDFNNGCEGELIRFYDRSTFLPGKDILTWSWDFGDPASGADNTSSSPDPQHIFLSEGDYNVTLIITNGLCSDRITKTIQLHRKPISTLSFPDGYCEKEITQIYLNDADATFLSADWNFDDTGSGDNNIQKGLTGYHAFANSGSYNPVANVTSIYGCTTTMTAPVNIVQNTLSGTIASSEGLIFCEGKSTELTSPSGGVEWLWSNQSIVESTSITESGIYNLKLKDIQGCSYRPDDIIIQVLPLPSTSIITTTYIEDDKSSSTDLPVSICYGTNVLLTLPVQANYEYLWNTGLTGDRLSYTDENNNLLNSGIYPFSVQVTDKTTGCTNVSRVTDIQVNKFNGQVKISADQTGTLCEGNEHQLSVDNPIAGINYIWNQQQTTTTITTSLSGTYFVTAKDGNGCTSQSNQIDILSGPDVSLIPSGCFERCGADTLCYPNISNITKYQWHINGTEISSSAGGNLPYPIFKESGAYTLLLTGSNGCTNISKPLNLDIKKITGHIFGKVYVDVNANQKIDSQDTLISGIKLDLPGLSKVSDTNGSFIFENLMEGKFYPNMDESTLPLGAKIVIDSLLANIRTCDDSIFLEYLIGFDCFAKNTTQSLQVCYGEKIKIGGKTISADTSLMFLNTNTLGCIDTLVYDIQFTPKINYTFETFNACPGGSNGKVIVTIDHPERYTYTLNGQQSASKNNEFLALASKEYQLVIKDQNGCKVSSSLKVSELPDLEVNMEASKISCQTGLATIKTIEASYDFNQLQFKWQSGQTDKDISISAVGEYNVSISNACETIVKTISVLGQDTKNVFKKYVVCSGRSLELFGVNYHSDTLFYTTLTNSAGCVDTTTHDLRFGAKFTYEVDVNGHCNGKSNGQIVIQNPPSGNIVYQLDGEEIVPENGAINNLPEGTYQLSVKSDLGCEQKHEVVIAEKEKIRYEVLSEDLSCFKGYAAVSLQLANYDTTDVQINWGNGKKGDLINVTEAGWLNFTVSNGCDTIADKVNIISTDSEPTFQLPSVVNPVFDNGLDFIDIQKTDFRDGVIKTVAVTDRMGRRLYTTNNMRWTGNESLPDGIYFYTIEAEVNICGTSKTIAKTGKLLMINR